MFSNLFPPVYMLICKVALIVLAALTAARAAHLWSQASNVKAAEIHPDTGYADNPALDILSNTVGLYSIQAAYNASSILNAKAARWSLWAAGFAGIAALLGL